MCMNITPLIPQELKVDHPTARKLLHVHILLSHSMAVSLTLSQFCKSRLMHFNNLLMQKRVSVNSDCVFVSIFVCIFLNYFIYQRDVPL